MALADHVQVVGVVGQLAAQAQVAQHHVDGGVGAHRHHVRVHQAAGAVLVVGQHLLQALAVLAIHRLQDFVDHRVRQVLDQVGQVVDVEVGGGGDQFVRIHVRDQAFAHLVADVHQHLAVVLGIDQAPDHGALAGRQRFQQVADFRRRQRVDQPAHRAEATGVERVRKQTQLARGLVVADGFGHCGFRWAASRHEVRDRDQVFMARALSPANPSMPTPCRLHLRRRSGPCPRCPLTKGIAAKAAPTRGRSMQARLRCRRGRARAAAWRLAHARPRGRSRESRGALPAGWRDAG